MHDDLNRLRNQATVQYRLDTDGSYVIDNYDAAPAFCSFLPGIGGPDGVPLWCMYVNRAQAVVSFGVHSKDQAIAEFLPATWAYQLVGIQGFRTFCRVNGAYYEPFAGHASAPSHRTRTMRIRPDQVELREVNVRLGLSFVVDYFTPVSQPLGSLARRLHITNEAASSLSLTLLDGLALILPAGFTDHNLKAMRHISEAYAATRLIDGTVPYYSAKVVAHDEAEVAKVIQGSFYAAWAVRSQQLQPIEPFVDPDLIFGPGRDLITPRRFIADGLPDRAVQIWENRLPCALAPLDIALGPGESVELHALAGWAPNEQMMQSLVRRFAHPDDFDAALADSHRLIDDITTPAHTHSSVPTLDAYCRQNFLDNVLRGGVPVRLDSRSGPALLHLYARRHGDLERDYNHFVLPPHPLSSGAGHYRDMCQNQRWDAWFYPEVAEREIKDYLGLLQADGYNPLSLEGNRWIWDQSVDPLSHCPAESDAARDEFRSLLGRPIHPGQLLHWAHVHEIALDDPLCWLGDILARADRTLIAGGHEGGYWIDHWTYIVDLLEAFAAVYPDRVREMLTGSADVGWFDEGAYVVPRAEKHVMRPTGLLQLGAVVDGPLTNTALPPVSALGKLVGLIATKAVSFDYDGRGIEMEAGRPGWNDSLNGLPGLFGSSTCEAAELARLAGWLGAALPDLPDTVLPGEVADLIDDVVADLRAADYSWDRAATIRERFRRRARHQASGDTRTVSGALLTELLTGAEQRARKALQRSIDPDTGLLHTYYLHKPAPHATPRDDSSSERGYVADTIQEFVSQPLPLFLEGQVHWLRLQDAPGPARAIHAAVRRSALFDTSLKMFKLNECLDSCAPEIGRARTFTRGWFENESVWLHMSYKYLLELLRAGLHAEFFEGAQTMLVPFMDPQVYGRSILENSSFLASSANPDPATHGRGFIARLSGATAEFIHMWLLLTVGPKPFALHHGRLHLRLRPALPGAWFTRQAATTDWRGQATRIPENSFACALLGSMLLIYHNPSRRDTFGPNAAHVVRYVLDERHEVNAAYLDEDLARGIRDRAFHRLDVWLD